MSFNAVTNYIGFTKSNEATTQELQAACQTIATEVGEIRATVLSLSTVQSGAPLSARSVSQDEVINSQSRALLVGKLLCVAASVTAYFEGDMLSVMKYSPLLYCAAKVLPQSWVRKIEELEVRAELKVSQFFAYIYYSASHPREAVKHALKSLCELANYSRTFLTQLPSLLLATAIKVGQMELDLIMALLKSWKALATMAALASVAAVDHFNTELGISGFLAESLQYVSGSQVGSVLESTSDYLPYKTVGGGLFVSLMMALAIKSAQSLSNSMLTVKEGTKAEDFIPQSS